MKLRVQDKNLSTRFKRALSVGPASGVCVCVREEEAQLFLTIFTILLFFNSFVFALGYPVLFYFFVLVTFKTFLYRLARQHNLVPAR